MAKVFILTFIVIVSFVSNQAYAGNKKPTFDETMSWLKTNLTGFSFTIEGEAWDKSDRYRGTTVYTFKNDGCNVTYISNSVTERLKDGWPYKKEIEETIKSINLSDLDEKSITMLPPKDSYWLRVGTVGKQRLVCSSGMQYCFDHIDFGTKSEKLFQRARKALMNAINICKSGANKGNEPF